MDGDGDRIADPKNPRDTLLTIGTYLQQFGYTEQDIKTALWHYYKRELTVLSIMNYAKLFKKYQSITFDTTAFPIPKGYNYSYRNTWEMPEVLGAEESMKEQIFLLTTGPQ